MGKTNTKIPLMFCKNWQLQGGCRYAAELCRGAADELQTSAGGLQMSCRPLQGGLQTQLNVFYAIWSLLGGCRGAADKLQTSAGGLQTPQNNILKNVNSPSENYKYFGWRRSGPWLEHDIQTCRKDI